VDGWLYVVGGVLLGLVLVVAGLWLSRTRTLDHRVGSFTCALGRSASGPWRRGVAQYGAGSLYWWRRRSLAPRPAHRWDRSALVVLERVWIEPSAPGGVRQARVHCRVGDEVVELLMTAEAYAGLTSWIEATPPAVGAVI